MTDFDPEFDKLPDQPVTIGGDKSAAAWHSNSAPEVPHALIARLRAEEEQVRDDAATGRVASSPAEMRRSADLYREAAEALAALGDTVPASVSPAIAIRAEYENTVLAKQLVEARAERDALAHVIEQAKAAEVWGMGRVVECLNAAPSAYLRALHDAEVKAQALDEAKQIVTTVCRDELSDYYGQVRVEVNAALDRRAAAIREEAN